MPESPDLQVFARNLNALFEGKRLLEVKVVNGRILKHSQDEFTSSLEGKVLQSVHRSGKELRLVFSGEVVVGIHLMLHGSLQLFEKVNNSKFIIVEFHFENGKGLALTDWQAKANVSIDPVDKDGIDVLSEELTVDYIKKVLQTKTSIKKVLMDQNIIRGIGNAYADEILWEARISPFSKSLKIPEHKLEDLLAAIKHVLLHAERQIMKAKPGIISGEVRDFLVIHNASRDTSPTGATIKVDKVGGRSTYYTDEQQLYT